MPRYLVLWDYVGCCGKYPGGKAIELDEKTAEVMNRDSRGVLQLIDETPPPKPPEPEPPFMPEAIEPASELPPELEERAMDKPPHDRQVKKPTRKRRR